MGYLGGREFILIVAQTIALPYKMNDDGEPELRETPLTPEQFVSVDHNPLLYFVKNFNAFQLQDDVTGKFDDKFAVYRAAVYFIQLSIGEIVLKEDHWLLDKNTYINEFGTARKIKGFITKCKELTDNAQDIAKLDAVRQKVLSEIESDKQE